jgi:hypothetical protein
MVEILEGKGVATKLEMRGTDAMLRRAKQIYQTQGLLKLLQQGLTWLSAQFFEYHAYYLYCLSLEDDPSITDANPIPPLEDISPRIVSTISEAEQLEADGFEFYSITANAREKLESGAIATCVFVGKELANLGWVAMTQEAKDSLKSPPFEIDFSSGECWSSHVWTKPKYRRTGLLVYADMKRRQFQLQQGVRVSKWAINKRNIPPQRLATRLSFQICGQGRYVRILCWKSWKEEPLTHHE